MDDDLVDVLIVLGVLVAGLLGLLVLLALNVERFRRFLLCCRKEKKEPMKFRKRTTIKVVRKANTINVEDPRSVASKTPVTRIFSSPLPERDHVPSPTVHQEFIFIVPKSPSYKAEFAHSIISAQTSNSTASSYLPNQMTVLSSRRSSA